MARRKRRVVYRYPRRRRRSSKRSFTVPLAVVGGALGSFGAEITAAASGDWIGAANNLQASFSDAGTAIQKMLPLFTGIIIHLIASKLGVNRILGRSGIPFLRV